MHRFGCLLLLALAGAASPRHRRGAGRRGARSVTSCVNDAGDAGCTTRPRPRRRLEHDAQRRTGGPRTRPAFWRNGTLGSDRRVRPRPGDGRRSRSSPGRGGLHQRDRRRGAVTARGLTEPDGIFAQRPTGRFVLRVELDEGGVAVLDRPAAASCSTSAQQDGCITDTGARERAGEPVRQRPRAQLRRDPARRSARTRAHLYAGLNPVAVARAATPARRRLSQDAGQRGLREHAGARTAARRARAPVRRRQPAPARRSTPDGRQPLRADGRRASSSSTATPAPASSASADGGGGLPRGGRQPGRLRHRRRGSPGRSALVASARRPPRVRRQASGGIVTLARAADGALAVQQLPPRDVGDGRVHAAARRRAPGSPTRRSARTGSDLVASQLRRRHLHRGLPRAIRSTGAVARGSTAAAPPTAGRSAATGAARRVHARTRRSASDTHVTFAQRLAPLQRRLLDLARSPRVKRDFAPGLRRPARRPSPHNDGDARAGSACRDRQRRSRSPSSIAERAALGLARRDRPGAGPACFYDPFGGFSGRGRLHVPAPTAAGLDSAPARVALDVAPPRRRRAAAAAADRRRSSTTRWGARGKRIFLLVARRAAARRRGARLELRCAGSEAAPVPVRQARHEAAAQGVDHALQGGRARAGGGQPGAPVPRRPAAAGARHRAGPHRQGRGLRAPRGTDPAGRPALPARRAPGSRASDAERM